MKTPSHIILLTQSSLLLVGICPLLCGCSNSGDTTALGPTVSSSAPNTEPTSPSSNNNWTSDVQLTLPDIETGSTHELRAEGACNLSVHDRSNPFEFELNGMMSYRVRISTGPFVEDEWLINPLVDITNETGSQLYMQYYAAFFNRAGRLVGCVNQGTADYDIYLATRIAPHDVRNAEGVQLEQYDSWETDIEFERRKRIKGITTILHAALLDESGRLIVCDTGSTRRLAAPADKLLSASQLEMIVYESGGSIQLPTPKVASTAPPEVAKPSVQKREPPAKPSAIQPPKDQPSVKKANDAPPVNTLPEIDRPNERGFTQLHVAAMAGEVDAVKKLIADGADANAPQQIYQGAPLQYAAARGHINVMNLLLKAGAKVDSKDSAGRTPLFWAVKENQPQAAVLLLDKGTDPFDRAAQSIIDRLKVPGKKELVEAFDEYFAMQSTERWLRWQVASLTFTVELEGRTVSLMHHAEPLLLNWAGATNDTLQGRLDVWTADRIPFAVSSHLIQKNGKLFRSLALLRESPVKGVAGDETIWQPAKRDHSWIVVPDGGVVSKNAEQRLQQMKSIAERFSMADRTLGPEPVLRYKNGLKGQSVVDAGIFAFLKNDWPHGLLTLESRGKGEDVQWHYTLTRLTAPPANIQFDGKSVYEWPGYWANPRGSDDDFVEQQSAQRRR